MPSPVSSIRNLGPAMDAACAKAGIFSAEELRDLGADETYARLLSSGMKPHFIGYYVLVMGLQGRPWNDCKGEEKKALRRRFDTLKATAIDDSTGMSFDPPPQPSAVDFSAFIGDVMEHFAQLRVLVSVILVPRQGDGLIDAVDVEAEPDRGPHRALRVERR